MDPELKPFSVEEQMIISLVGELNDGWVRDVRIAATDLVTHLLNNGRYPSNIGLLSDLFDATVPKKELRQWLRLTLVNVMLAPRSAVADIRLVQAKAEAPNFLTMDEIDKVFSTQP